MNTFEKGTVKILLYKDTESGVWYGSALEFNLTVDGDDREVVFLELSRAIKDYIVSAREIGSVALLNQEADPELLALWHAHSENRTLATPSPYMPSFAGTESIAHG